MTLGEYLEHKKSQAHEELKQKINALQVEYAYLNITKTPENILTKKQRQINKLQRKLGRTYAI